MDLNNLASACFSGAMKVCRLPLLNRTSVYSLFGLALAQASLERLARCRAIVAFRRAQRHCPGYAKFLADQSWPGSVSRSTFADIPETTKQNYVRVYSIEQRCFKGVIPRCGVVIDESSGSSGEPSNWVRGPDERASVRRLLEHSVTMRFRDRALFLVNCFALGPWATGMNVTMSLVDRCIVKSVGPDRAKLENTLRTFGPGYEYAIAGYPPFIKDFLDRATIDLSQHTMHLLVGGEGISEPLRDHFLQFFASVTSSYGASDLEINLAAETPLSIAVRRLCLRDHALCRTIFDRDEPSMLFQYNPVDYLIETNPSGELVFTLLRAGYAAPRIRYNLRDVGHVITHRRLLQLLRHAGIDVAALPRGPAFPFLAVGGRSDLTVGFYGAKIFVTDVDAAIAGDANLHKHVHSFQVRVVHDTELTERLHIDLEQSATAPELQPAVAHHAILTGLSRVNQDFREVSRMFSGDSIVVLVHRFGTGPFEVRDVRVKNRYLGEPAQS